MQGHLPASLILPKKETSDWNPANAKWEYQMRKKEIAALAELMWRPCNSLIVSNRTLTSADKFDSLEGDTYDYKIITAQASLGTNLYLYAQFNGDTGANYTRENMYGYGTSVNADNTATSPILLSFNGTDTNYMSLVETIITGKSGSKRSVEQRGFGSYDTTRYAEIYNFLWDNTVNEITSIDFSDNGGGGNYTFEAYLFRRLKASTANDGYEQVSAVDIASGDTSIDFTGLAGDTDKEYILELQGLTNASAFNPLVRFNSDSGSNYIYQLLNNSAGTLTAGANTTTSILMLGADAGKTYNARHHIMAESGVQRAVISQGAVDDPQQRYIAQWWNNTASEITSINITIPSGTTGRAVLYKRASTESQLVSREAIDGDWSAGKTWSGLAGDTDGIYEIISVLTDKGTDAGTFEVQLNGDTGTNYEYQMINGHGTSVTAATNAAVSVLYGGAMKGQTTQFARMLIFPKSGKYRPVLIQRIYCATASTTWHVGFIPMLWKNTVNEITSIKAFLSDSTPIKGFVQLKKIPLT